MARQGALRGLDAVGSRAPVGWPGAHLDLAHTEVERERTRQVARIGSSRGDVGIWHETYRVRAGEYECVYSGMPPLGLAKASATTDAVGELESARGRLDRETLGGSLGTPDPARQS